MQFKKYLIATAAFACISSASAQSAADSENVLSINEILQQTAPAPVSVSDSLAAAMDSIGIVAVTRPLPEVLFLPPVYTGYDPALSRHLGRFPAHGRADADVPQWLATNLANHRFARALMQYHAIHNLDQVPYNINTMAEPPRRFVAYADPMSTVVVFREVGAMPGEVKVEKPTDLAAGEITRQHWLNKLGMLLQFSQAYVSPNWYQGGNNSLNLIADFSYDSKLNTKFHPDLLFENYFRWRTVLASAPDDPYRAYSLTENYFQVNSKFGYKAFKKWYYSFNGMLKTPVFNGYKNGTQTRTASFMSPGEVNIGLGMSFSTATKDGKFKYGLSISPLSYNLKTVLDSKVSETSHGLEEGHHTKSAYGSNLEMNWEWKIAYNVFWKSRIFCFTNYDYFQADWQNQFSFTINRWLSTNLWVDLRYDSSVPGVTAWKQLQLREQISLGFSYTINH